MIQELMLSTMFPVKGGHNKDIISQYIEITMASRFGLILFVFSLNFYAFVLESSVGTSCAEDL